MRRPPSRGALRAALAGARRLYPTSSGKHLYSDAVSGGTTRVFSHVYSLDPFLSAHFDTAISPMPTGTVIGVSRSVAAALSSARFSRIDDSSIACLGVNRSRSWACSAAMPSLGSSAFDPKQKVLCNMSG